MRKLTKTKTLAAILVAAAILTFQYELAGKCTVGLKGCQTETINGGVPPDCGNNIISHTSGACKAAGDVGAGQSCDARCQDHFSNKVNQTKTYIKQTFPAARCILSTTVETTVSINCPADDGACENKDGCE